MNKTKHDVREDGWGWVVVACSFVIHVLTLGVCFSLGGIYVAWLEEFKESKGLTSWVVSIAVALMLGVGPLPSALMDRFGSRAVQISGTILACLGFGLSSCVTSVPMLILTLGVLGGTGLGFCYLPAVTLIAGYFRKRRAMAYGIATSGVGIGSFLVAPFIDYLETVYGWRGALLILGGMILNINVCSLLMRPKLHSEEESEIMFNSEEDLRRRLEGIPFVTGPSDEYDVIAVENITRDRSCSNPAPANYVYTGRRERHNTEPTPVDPPSVVNRFRDRSNSNRGSLRSFDIMFMGSIHSLAVVHAKERSTNSLYSSLLANKRVSEKNETSTIESPSEASTHIQWKDTWHKTLVLAKNYFSLFKDKTFCSLAISQLLTNLSYLMPVLYLVDRAVENGIDKHQASLLMSINGIGNLIGRILFGVLADLPCSDSVVLYIVTLTLCGLGTCISPVCGGDYALHCVYAGYFGFTMGGYVTLSPVVCVDLMGVSRVGHAYGILLFCMGLSGALGPPLAGWVYDWTGDFTISFILHGAFIVLSALVLLPVTLGRLCCSKTTMTSPSNGV